MRLKVLLAACLGATVLPAAAAGAAEAIPGTCTRVSVYMGKVTRTTSACECVVGVEDVELMTTGEIAVTYCVAKTGLTGGSD